MAVTIATGTATVKGGLFAQYSTTLATVQNGSGYLRGLAAFALSRRAMLGFREVMTTLNGAALGSAASKTITRVEANSELGGKRTIETQTLVSGNTTAADITEINDDILTFNSYDSTPVANGDGNPLGVAH